jgi:hypothetical protein
LVVLRDSNNNPSSSGTGKNVSNLITVTNNSNAVQYEYDPVTDSFKVKQSGTEVGSVTFTKVDGMFDFSEGALIDPQASMTNGSVGHLKATLKDAQDVEVGNVTVDVNCFLIP